MGNCCSAPSAADAQPAAAPKGTSDFSNKRSKPIGDEAIPADRRCQFAMVFPESTGVRPCHMFFDKQKPVEKVIAGAAAHGGFKVDKGKLVGSPERLNLFTDEGDVVRLDLEIEAHLGSTLHEGGVLILEKGNRLDDARLDQVKQLRR